MNVSDHTFRLRSLYFLDPNWLCSILLSPINTKTKTEFSRQGTRSRRVPKEDLKICCRKSGFGEGRFEEYLELLGRFEIAIPATPDRLVKKCHQKRLIELNPSTCYFRQDCISLYLNRRIYTACSHVK